MHHRPARHRKEPRRRDVAFDEIDQQTFLRATTNDGRVVRTAEAEAYATRGGVITWDGDRAIRYDRVALPEPRPDDPEALVEPLAQALDSALRTAVADSPIDAPFCLRVHNGVGGSSPALPPVGLVASGAVRDRMRRASGNDGEAVDAIHFAAHALRRSRAGVPVELHLHPGAPHEFDSIAFDSAVARRAIADRVRVLRSI